MYTRYSISEMLVAENAKKLLITALFGRIHDCFTFLAFLGTLSSNYGRIALDILLLTYFTVAMVIKWHNRYVLDIKIS